jgi:sarcosine oxidase
VPEQWDFIILGLGAMGSAAAYHLARRGKRVLGLDRFHPPHTFGSSHGRTRIIREAYFEDPVYVPLVQRAYELWTDLGRTTGEQLFQQTGGLMIGPPGGIVVGGAKRSAEQHHLPHEVLSPAEVRKRFPALQPSEDMAAVLEPRAGVLFPEACIQAHLALARQSGAELRFGQPVIRWQARGEGVVLQTEKDNYSATTLILSAGAWLGSLVPELKSLLQVERQILFWFEPSGNPQNFLPSACPIYLWEYGSARFFYGFPDSADGVKVARHHEGIITDPDHVPRGVSDREIADMRSLLQRFVPDANGRLTASTVCLYTNTLDHHFLIDRHPEHHQVILASPCSGHGFKFSSAVGELLADIALEGRSRFDLSLFQLARFQQQEQQQQ